MRTVQVEKVIDQSRFNKFHLLVFLWCFFAISFDGFDIALYGIGLPLMMDDFGLSSAEGGAIGSYALIGMMLGTFILGSFSDMVGRKRMLALCLALISIFNMLAGFAPNATFFIIMRFIASMGMGGLMPVVISLMTEYSPKKNRAMTVAVMYCGYSIGAIPGFPDRHGSSGNTWMAVHVLAWRASSLHSSFLPEAVPGVPSILHSKRERRPGGPYTEPD